MTSHSPAKLLLPLFAAALALANERSVLAADRASWLCDARYGIMVHFLPSGPEWEKAVNDFDVLTFADDARAAGAKYVLFTLGQNSGYYCSPNATYERLAGYANTSGARAGTCPWNWPTHWRNMASA
jgi:hypothetical protein